ncbi:MAG TPA: electron transport complex subunit RsxB [Porticoccaceae bacterium]|nr:electron transport complex subunit RsxB [Porticoccaceae bacterium]
MNAVGLAVLALFPIGGLLALASLAWRHAATEPGADDELGADDQSGADDELAARIDALLPQTQCGRCGHPGCRPYARAIAAGEPFNRCPPGGNETIAALAELLGATPRPLDPAHGKPLPRSIAFIREAECIGCTKCLPACPVDAIVGATRQLHTVIAELCTGCDLCVEPCPVDCIEMIPVSAALQGVRNRPEVAA